MDEKLTQQLREIFGVAIPVEQFEIAMRTVKVLLNGAAEGEISTSAPKPKLRRGRPKSTPSPASASYVNSYGRQPVHGTGVARILDLLLTGPKSQEELMAVFSNTSSKRPNGALTITWDAISRLKKYYNVPIRKDASKRYYIAQ